MSNADNQGNDQPTPAPPPPTPNPAPQQDIVDLYTNPTLIGTDKKSDTDPAPNTETR